MKTLKNLRVAFDLFITQNNLFANTDRLLIATSGGVDSMVLCHLLLKRGHDVGIAHCNFGLRGEESEGDESFIRRFCHKNNLPCHIEAFDTEGYAAKMKIGIQEAARQLRYDFFEKTRQNYDYQWIITAHHASDRAETLLFNLAKGTGLRGLKSIAAKNGLVARPLLNFFKNDIMEFAEDNDIDFREDSSNESDKYTRNFIRHRIIPSFYTLNPNIETTLSENFTRFEEAYDLLGFFIEKIKADITKVFDNQFFISISDLKQYPSVSTILYEILLPFGFNNDQVNRILGSHNDVPKTGAKFYSATHVLLIDRSYYIIAENTPTTEQAFFIEKNASNLTIEDTQFIVNQSVTLPFLIEKNKNIAQFDAHKLAFPLKLRRWQQGDSFQPFGMGGKSQKLSDFFAHNKFTDFEKHKTWLLETANGDICWVAGHRIDERFKIDDSTSVCFSIKMEC